MDMFHTLDLSNYDSIMFQKISLRHYYDDVLKEYKLPLNIGYLHLDNYIHRKVPPLILTDHARFIKKLEVKPDDICKYEAAYEYIEYLMTMDIS